ncbi:carboxypeptidase regulatory-like domain-containing protein [Pyxidicoccus fallax]|uniref:Carboxypeptidase regulatory-like domain-containing protein n=1 Tax=Pyxidicoccus fallax TaxID=394095 RepID=A0A848L4B4_9BACT|nr:carboxypeptidase-like regulatory domain-containing protein [Pyxidicoccus fallax]NMO13554.1 carboxypeptidase regulatory-like domain-containing protein [Pyxidicoccus fallax]NPC76738.1 carboxypeptidase regulatory-like domain-containing protein [Pyxidicoccus fallax]
MRYRLVAGGALLLLLALLLAIASGGREGRRASVTTRAAGTGPDSSTAALEAHESAVLRGWVQDARGLPVAAQVLAFEAAPPLTREGLERHMVAEAPETPPLATATTGPDGAFLLRVPEGRYHLLAERGGQPAALALDVRPGPSEVRLVVADGERLTGQVVSVAGGVARARVTVVSLAPALRLREVESDETGAFEVEGLFPQERYGVWARAAGHGPRGVLVPASRPVTVMLPCALRLEGRVLERGVAAPGARVRPRGGGPEARADSAGRFVLEDIDCSGRTELLAESTTGVGELAIEPLSEDTSGLDIPLETAGGLRVRVVEARSGRLLEGASLQSPAAPEVVWREEDVGHFRAAPLMPGPHAVLVRAPGHGAVQRVLEVGAGPDTQVEVELPPESVLAGRVLGPEGLGMEGARIHLVGAGRSGAEEVLTGADGRFEVRGLTEDTYELRVERQGYLPVTRELRLPRAGPLELSLAPAAAVAVKVLGARGEPVEDAAVSLSRVGETVREEGTDTRGGVHFGGLVPGSYLARARAQGYLPSEPVPVEAWDEEAAPVTLVLREGLALSGRVRDARGAPVGEAEVVLMGVGMSVSSTRTDAQGRFTLSGLAPGRGQLRVEKLGHPLREAEVEVPASNLELVLESPRSE